MGRVAVRAQPGASKNRVVGRLGDEWKIAVNAPPVDGKANQALTVLLSAICNVPRAEIELLHGAGGRRKLFEIHGLESEAIDSLLAAHKAKT